MEQYLWADTSPRSAVESGFKWKSSIFISFLFTTDCLNSIIALNASHGFWISLSSWDIWHVIFNPLPENTFFLNFIAMHHKPYCDTFYACITSSFPNVLLWLNPQPVLLRPVQFCMPASVNFMQYLLFVFCASPIDTSHLASMWLYCLWAALAHQYYGLLLVPCQSCRDNIAAGCSILLEQNWSLT